ncbi:McrB family protein [Methanomethylophilus alvi]|uniref:McrB family protein n=1 Tax=Methanomethylophilus alvi TaxID=1291540 RepID=UPI0037DC5500
MDTGTIKKARSVLISRDIQPKKNKLLMTFLIMKAAGFNNFTYESPASLKNSYTLGATFRLTSLFSPEEQIPEKCSFISPQSLNSWDGAPTEPLKTYLNTRVKNNFAGGGEYWHDIVLTDRADLFKFSYDYVDLILGALNNVTTSMLAMAVWFSRFKAFDQIPSKKQLINEFTTAFNLTNEEQIKLFDNADDFELSFMDRMHDTQAIRELIPGKEKEWKQKMGRIDMETAQAVKQSNTSFKSADVDEKVVEYLLEKNKQVLLYGPPGTSKSYIANKIAKKYDAVQHIQFHPKYTYQQFVGGYAVEGQDVKYYKGLLLNTIEIAKSSKKTLLIIDEFNRANVNQVFGETIQCLDRGQMVSILGDKRTPITLELPDNLHILATMNSTDRTLSPIDYAIKRRFYNIYCPPNPNILTDLCPSLGFISLCDFLTKLNNKLVEVLNNREQVIGHALFLDNTVIKDGKYYWTFESFRLLFYYKILPIVEDYLASNTELLEEVFGRDLLNWTNLDKFKIALQDYVK